MSQQQKKYYLGIDCGSISVKIVVMDEDKNVLYEDYQRSFSEPVNKLKSVLAGLLSRMPDIREFEGVYTTGSGRQVIHELIGAIPVNEITTHGMAAAHFHPDARSIIEIGGQDSKLIFLAPREDGTAVIADSQMNDLCAAGTGAFLDQQAFRMGIDVEELSSLACGSKKPAKISGRCSVFAKTDMIHLQQEGVATEDLCMGLCMAVARTYIESLVKGRAIQTPLLFQGGVARNKGVKKAFLQLLDLKEKDMIIPDHYLTMGAVGCVLYGIERRVLCRPLKREELSIRINALREVKEQNAGLPPLSEGKICYRDSPVADYSSVDGLEVYIGVDVGSVSAKIAVLDKEKNIVFKYYTATRGKAADAVKECFAAFKKAYPSGLRVKGVGVTGSGRDYIANFLNADVVKNEITAQARGISFMNPGVNTIIEIGGQDSKYIKINNGTIVDFAMNKTCAAGTGSFLMEQSAKLKIDNIGRFSEMAMSAPAPLDMGNRCTVFMETDCIHYQQSGYSKEDITAGLSYSIAKNYLEKVVGNKPITGKTIIAGGVAFNKSVVAAFGNILGKEIFVSSHNEVTGALGIALLAMEEIRGESGFIGFEMEDRIRQRTVSECKDCSNRCILVSVSFSDGNSSVYGGICGKYEKDSSRSSQQFRNYFEDRRKLLLSYGTRVPGTKGKIGIPRLLLFHELFPLWNAFFVSLGYEVILSGDMSRKIYEKGLSRVMVGTCFSLKCIYGAVIDLVEKGVDRIFIPYVLNMKDDAYETRFAHNCQYVQQTADFVKSSFDIKVLTHTVRMKEKEDRIALGFCDLGAELGVSRDESLAAYEKGTALQKEFYTRCGELGKNALREVAEGGKAFVLIGHPYVVHDSFFNLNIVKRLSKIGIPLIPGDLLPVKKATERSRAIDLNWKSNNRAINIVEYICQYNKEHDGKLYPLVMTQFGCAADSMLTPYLRDFLKEIPWLEIEVDEHNSTTGLITRCEAFWESVSGEDRESATYKEVSDLFDVGITLRQVRREKRKVYVFQMAEAFSIIPEVFEKYGIPAEMTLTTTPYSNDMGRKHTNEKQCRTFQVVIGDFLATAGKKDFVDDHSAMFMIDYEEACRAALFKSLSAKVLRENGKEVKMLGVTVDDPVSWIQTFGMNMALDLWSALVAADCLVRYQFELRPYEKEKGSVDRAYEKAREILYRGVHKGGLLNGFKKAMDTLKAVPREERDLVEVAVVGDAFTRVHHYGMGEIFRIIEEMNGVVILPPSWHDFVNYGSQVRAKKLLRNKQFLRGVFTKIGSINLNSARKKIHDMASAYSSKLEEPSNAELDEYARDYVNLNVAPVLPSMFIGKTVDFVKEKKVDGLINAFGFNCSLGIVSTVCIERMRKDYDLIPMLTFVDDGLQQTNIRTRVEAFMEQVWARKKGNVCRLTYGNF